MVPVSTYYNDFDYSCFFSNLCPKKPLAQKLFKNFAIFENDTVGKISLVQRKSMWNFSAKQQQNFGNSKGVTRMVSNPLPTTSLSPWMKIYFLEMMYIAHSPHWSLRLRSPWVRAWQQQHTLFLIPLTTAYNSLFKITSPF